VLTTTVTETQFVVPQVPTALSQYVVVMARSGVVKVRPVPTCNPPQDPVYQRHTAASVPRLPPEKLSQVDQLAQIAAELATAHDAPEDACKTVTFTVTQEELLHPAIEVFAEYVEVKAGAPVTSGETFPILPKQDPVLNQL